MRIIAPPMPPMIAPMVAPFEWDFELLVGSSIDVGDEETEVERVELPVVEALEDCGGEGGWSFRAVSKLGPTTTSALVTKNLDWSTIRSVRVDRIVKQQ